MGLGSLLAVFAQRAVGVAKSLPAYQRGVLLGEDVKATLGAGYVFFLEVERGLLLPFLPFEAAKPFGSGTSGGGVGAAALMAWV